MLYFYVRKVNVVVVVFVKGFGEYNGFFVVGQGDVDLIIVNCSWSNRIVRGVGIRQCKGGVFLEKKCV